MIRRLERKVLLCGPDLGVVEALAHSAMRAQTSASEADWPLPRSARANLSNDGDDFLLTSFGPHPFWGRFFDVSRQATYAVEIREMLTMKIVTQYATVALVLDALSSGEKELTFLEEVALALGGRKPHATRRLVLVLTDALSQLRAPPAPVDTLDAWERVRSGEQLGAPPMKKAMIPEQWISVLDEIDRLVGRRLRGIANTAHNHGIEVVTLPVSATGFNAHTGAILSVAGAPSIAFNLKTFVYCLAPELPITFPILLRELSQ